MFFPQKEKRKMMDDHMKEAQVSHLNLVTRYVCVMDSKLMDMTHKIEMLTMGSQSQSIDVTGVIKQLPLKNEKHIRELQVGWVVL